MATAAQILANRENALHSTGPTTAQGKSASAQNAARHSLTARGLIVLPGLEDAFARLDERLRAELLPTGELQETIFKLVLESAWNIERCRLAQAQLYAQAEDAAIDPLLDDAIEAKFSRIQKYSRQYQSSLFKAMRELGRLQTEAHFRQNHASPAAEVSAVCSLQQVEKKASPAPKRPSRAVVQNEANLADQKFLAMLEQATAPPIPHFRNLTRNIGFSEEKKS